MSDLGTLYTTITVFRPEHPDPERNAILNQAFDALEDALRQIADPKVIAEYGPRIKRGDRRDTFEHRLEATIAHQHINGVVKCLRTAFQDPLTAPSMTHLLHALWSSREVIQLEPELDSNSQEVWSLTTAGATVVRDLNDLDHAQAKAEFEAFMARSAQAAARTQVVPSFGPRATQRRTR